MKIARAPGAAKGVILDAARCKGRMLKDLAYFLPGVFFIGAYEGDRDVPSDDEQSDHRLWIIDNLTGACSCRHLVRPIETDLQQFITKEV